MRICGTDALSAQWRHAVYEYMSISVYECMNAYLRGFVFGSVEGVLHGQHGYDCQDLLRAAQLVGHDEHLGQRRLQGELGHLPSQAGEQPLLIQRALYK
jgi:hypothetical protein